MEHTREHRADIAIYGEKELRELQAAGKQRVDALEKAVKKADDEYRPEEAAVTRTRLRLWQGETGEPGILARIADQMSLYEPAFSSNGKEPAGQGDLLDGVDRATPEPTTPVVDVQALKALLILTDLTGDVGDEAFDKLDGEIEEHLRTAALGRAPLELLHALPAVDAFALYQLAEGAHTRGEEGARETTHPDAQALFGKLATQIAQHGATEPPYFEVIPIVEESQESERFDEAREFTDEEFFDMTDRQLEAVYQRAVAVAEAEVAAEGAETGPSDAETRQEEILIHEPATGDEFRACVEIASLWACQGALKIVEGLDGNKVREAAIRKRIAVLVGSPEGAYDLTPARKKAIEVMAAAYDHSADISNRTAAEDAKREQSATVATKVADWLVDEKLAERKGDAIHLSTAGLELAGQLGHAPVATAEQDVPEGVVDPSDDDIGGPIEGSADVSTTEALDENEWGDGEPVGAGVGSALDDQDELL